MLQRYRINMTSREFFWVAVSILVLGVLTGWGLFSTPQLGRKLVLDNGNVADWMAAAGTWVIGYGAWKYARANHEHHVRVAMASELRELNRALSMLTSIIALLGRLNGPTFGFRFADDDEADWDEKIEHTLDNILEVVSTVQWDRAEREVLDGPSLRAHTLAEAEFHKLVFSARRVLKIVEGHEDLAADAAEQMLVPLRTSAQTLTDYTEEIRLFVLPERRRVFDRIKALKATLATPTQGKT